MFGHAAYSKSDMQTLEEAKRYTDHRIIESQRITFSAISDITTSITLLTRILCQSELQSDEEKQECTKELSQRNNNGTTTN
ncbi:hypothetical protein D9M71_718650 [compost metagenome]